VYVAASIAGLVLGCAAAPRGGAGDGAGHCDLPAEADLTPMLYSKGYSFAEGPAFDRSGNLYVVNYERHGTIGKTTPDGKTGIFIDLRDPSIPGHHTESRVNGLKVDRCGRVIGADYGAKRLIRVRPDGKHVDVLADKDADGKPFAGLNDCALDLAGNIYFSDPTGSDEKNPVGSIYRYDIRAKNVSRLDSGLMYPNGVGVTPDQKHLCVSESRGFRMLIYDLGPDGSVTNKRVLTQFAVHKGDNEPGSAGVPDGLIFDVKGRLYVPMWVGAVVKVIDVPTGRVLRSYDAGGSKATNVHFFKGDLYVTVAAEKAVFKLPLGIEGFDYNGRR